MQWLKDQGLGMGYKTHMTAVVVIPSREVWEPIQAIRREHDRQYRRWMPHITLLYPFRPREEFDQVAPRLAEKCAEIAPVSVTLLEFRYFRHRGGKHTIWLVPEPKEALVELQSRIQNAVPDCNDQSRHKDGFTPHLSVAQASGKEARLDLLNKFRGNWKPLTFEVPEISVIYRGDPPDDIFRVDRTVILGKE